MEPKRESPAGYEPTSSVEGKAEPRLRVGQCGLSADSIAGWSYRGSVAPTVAAGLTAVTDARFAEAIEQHGHRIGNFRLFAMTDHDAGAGGAGRGVGGPVRVGAGRT